jgi:hypothetical protein
MRELPILMNGAMVRAVLEGRKTVTRRVMKRQPEPCYHRLYEEQAEASVPTRWTTDATGDFYCGVCGNGLELCRGAPGVRGLRPPYQVGDRLYVREAYFGNHYLHPNEPTHEREIHYRADGYDEFEGERIVWRPSLHMPKWAARIWLQVTAARVERLRDITAEQAIAEGMQSNLREHDAVESLRNDFAYLWNGLAKPGNRWDDNPWVWVVEFKRIEKEVPHVG